MSELQASILPEKQVFVLDQNGYYSVSSTVADKKKSKEPGFTNSESGNPFIVNKQVKVEFDVKNEITGYSGLTESEKKNIQDKLSEPSDEERKEEGTRLEMPDIYNLITENKTNISAISIKDPNMVDVYLHERAYNRDGLQDKYILNSESSAFFHRSKEPIIFLHGEISPFKIYLVIDGNDINVVAMYKYVRGSRYERPIKSVDSLGIININDTEYFTDTIKLPDFDRENTLILINYKEEIEFYLSHSAFINLVKADPSEKGKYEYEPYVFYKRKKEHELLEEKGSAISSKLKTDEEGREFQKRVETEYQRYITMFRNEQYDSLFIEYKFPLDTYLDDPRFRALLSFLKAINAQKVTFVPIYKDSTHIYYRLFKDDDESFGFFLSEYEQYEIDKQKGNPTKTYVDSVKKEFNEFRDGHELNDIIIEHEEEQRELSREQVEGLSAAEVPAKIITRSRKNETATNEIREVLTRLIEGEEDVRIIGKSTLTSLKNKLRNVLSTLEFNNATDIVIKPVSGKKLVCYLVTLNKKVIDKINSEPDKKSEVLSKINRETMWGGGNKLKSKKHYKSIINNITKKAY